MMYEVKFSAQALKDLKKLDNYSQRMIMAWIKKNLVDCENPRQHGKALTANHKGEWRYRVGDYRILAEILDDTIIIYVLTVGHRKEVYK